MKEFLSPSGKFKAYFIWSSDIGIFGGFENVTPNSG